MYRFSLIAIFLLLFLGCEVHKPMQIGARFPEIELQSIKGESLRLPQKKSMIVRFWQTHCTSCIRELPILDTFYQEHGSKLDVIAINVGESKETLLGFLGRYKLHHHLVADEAQDFSKLFGVVAIPTTFFVNSEGIITDIIYGESSPFELTKRLQNIIN